MVIETENLHFTTKRLQYQLPIATHKYPLWQRTNILFLGTFSPFVYSTLQHKVDSKCSQTTLLPSLLSVVLGNLKARTAYTAHIIMACHVGENHKYKKDDVL